MKRALREQLEQAVKLESEVFAERVRSDECEASVPGILRQAPAGNYAVSPLD
jgi:hypothetical protein